MSGRWASALAASTCFGVDLRGGRRVMVLAERSGSRISFSPVPSSDRRLSAKPGKGVAVAGCMTVREGLIRWLEAPFTSSDKAARVFPTLLDIQLPFPLEDCTCEFLPAGTEGGKTRALAVAARREDVAKKIAELAAAGLDPMVMDHEGLALWTESLRQAPAGRGGDKGLRAVVNLCGEESALVVGRGEQFLGAHGIRMGDMGQVRRTLKLYLPAEGAAPAVTWMWAGADARGSAEGDRFRAELEREWPGPSHVHEDPDAFLARAVAARALTAGPLRCNLRSGDLAHPAVREREGRRAAMAAAMLLVAGFLLCGFNVAARSVAAARESALDRTFGALADELAGYPVVAKGEHAVRMVDETAGKRIEAMRPFLNLFDPPLEGVLVLAAEAGRTNSLHFEMLSVDRKRVQVNGTAKTWTGCDGLAAALRAAGYAVKLDRKDAGADGIVPFSLTTGGAP